MNKSLNCFIAGITCKVAEYTIWSFHTYHSYVAILVAKIDTPYPDTFQKIGCNKLVLANWRQQIIFSVFFVKFRNVNSAVFLCLAISLSKCSNMFSCIKCC